MKILFVIKSFDPTTGGAIGVAADEVVSFVRAGHDVTVFTGSNELKQTTTSVWEGARIVTIPTKDVPWMYRTYVCVRNPAVEKIFRTFVTSEKPDVVHFHNVYFHFPFSLLKIARVAGAKVFFTAHDVMTISPNKLVHFVSKDSDSNTIQDYRFSLYREWKQNGKAFNPIRRFAIRYYLQVAHKIFAVSAELKRALEVNGINNVEVLHNAVDLSQYTGDPNAAVVLKREIGLADTNKVILVAGRMSADKGGIEAVRIFKEVLVKTPDAVLVVLSGNEYTSHMMHEARQLGIDRNVRCIEAVPRPKMITYYELSDVVIMTSLCLETFGMVALEAMAMKKPVVVSSFGGTRELVTQGVNGYVVNPLRTKEFADKIVEVISDDARAHRMGLQSRNIAEKQFSLDRHVDKLLTWYISFDRE